LKTCTAKFEKWILDFSFTDIAAAAQSVDWTQVPVVDLRNLESFNDRDTVPQVAGI
jgi:hypothetical protein